MYNHEFPPVKIPALVCSETCRIILGALTLIPLIFLPGLLNIPLGVAATSFSKAVGISWLGRLLLRLGQIVLFFYVWSAGGEICHWGGGPVCLTRSGAGHRISKKALRLTDV